MPFPGLRFAGAASACDCWKLLEERLTPDVLRREISPRTRVVAVSWVSYADGYRHDLKRLAEVAHESGALFCVDAIQGLGRFSDRRGRDSVPTRFSQAVRSGCSACTELRFSTSARDLQRALAAGDARLALRAKTCGTFTTTSSRSRGRRCALKCGTPNLLGTLSLVCAIDLFTRCGPHAIARHVLALTDRLCEGLRSTGRRALDAAGRGHLFGDRYLQHARVRQHRARACAGERSDPDDVPRGRGSRLAARV